MPSQHRAPQKQAPGPEVDGPPPGAGFSPRHGNAAAQQQLAGEREGGLDGPIEDKVPEGIDLKSAYLGFTIPDNTDLTGNWNQLRTDDTTRVRLHVSREGLQISFSPALTVDAQWPVSNVRWSSLDYDFESGGISNISLYNDQFGFSAKGSVERSIREFIQTLVGGTALAKAGYDPMKDPDLGATLKQIQANANAAGKSTKKGDLDANEMTSFSAGATFALKEGIERTEGDGGVSIGAGEDISVSVNVAGDGATLGEGGVPDVRSVDVSSEGIVLKKGGEPIARLESFSVYKGGKVDVRRFKGLGKLSTFEGIESMAKLFVVLGQVSQARGNRAALRNINGDISPRAVDQMAEEDMEKALTEAVRKLVLENPHAVPGVDLRAVLGIEADGGGEEKGES